MIDLIRSSVIGDGTVLTTPYGHLRLTYADYTATGRALTFVESYIQQCVLLCQKCNMGIGSFCDSALLLTKAAAYLKCENAS